jgi:hypothetical protein
MEANSRKYQGNIKEDFFIGSICMFYSTKKVRKRKGLSNALMLLSSVQRRDRSTIPPYSLTTFSSLLQLGWPNWWVVDEFSCLDRRPLVSVIHS